MPVQNLAPAPKKRKWTLAPQVREEREQAIAPLFRELKAQGRSQSWLARKLGVSVRLVNFYAHGQCRIPDHLLTDACELIGYSRAWLDAQSPLLRKEPERVTFDAGTRRAS